MELAELAVDSVFTPCVVLLSVRAVEKSLIGYWENLLCFLLSKGVEYVLCAGEFSETLHDAIDDFLCRYDEEHNTDICNRVVTTYHAEESDIEVSDFFVYATEVKDKERGRLFAILDLDEEADRNLLEALKEA